MNARDIRLITISREFGAGGSELAAALAARLGWPVLDHDIVHKVAARLRLDDGTVEHFDEHPPSLLARIATVLIIPQPDVYSFPIADDLPGHDVIAEVTRDVIEQAATTLPLIVVGHGAQCIFANRTDTLHVRVVAPLRDRLSRVANRIKAADAFAAALVRTADNDRQAYVQRYFHRNWHDCLLYDVQINTGTVAIDEAAGMVVELARLRTSAGVSAEQGQAGLP